MAPEQQLGSWNDEDFTEGGYFDDRDGTIVKAEVVAFDYAGQRPDLEPICALHVEIRPDDAEGDDDNRSEYYKIGAMSKFTPNADGTGYVSTSGAATSMNKTCKAALFIRALKDKGFQLSKLAAGVNALEGLHGHWNIVPMPVNVKNEKGEAKEAKILIVTKIHGEGATTKTKSDKPAAKRPPTAKTAAAPTTAAATPAAAQAAGAADPDAEAALTAVVMELFGTSQGKPIAKTLLPPAIFKGVQDSALRGKCLQLAANPAWLGAGAEVRGWNYAGGELSL